MRILQYTKSRKQMTYPGHPEKREMEIINKNIISYHLTGVILQHCSHQPDHHLTSYLFLPSADPRGSDGP